MWKYCDWDVITASSNVKSFTLYVPLQSLRKGCNYTAKLLRQILTNSFEYFFRKKEWKEKLVCKWKHGVNERTNWNISQQPEQRLLKCWRKLPTLSNILRVIHPKMKYLSSFIHPHIIPKPYAVFSMKDTNGEIWGQLT